MPLSDTKAHPPTGIIVDVAVPLGAHKTFAYTVPQSMAAGLRPGVRAVVPFGRKTVTGYVVRVPSAVVPAGVRLRPVLRILDTVPALSRDLIDLALWIADYYFTAPGEVIRGLLPPGSEEGTTTIVRLTPKTSILLSGGLRPQGLSSPELRLLELLAERGATPVTSLAKLSQSRNLSRNLDSLEHQGCISLEISSVPARNREKRQLGIRAIKTTVEATLNLTPQQQKLLRVLPSSGEPVLLQAALRAAAVTPGVARALSRLGFAEVAPLAVTRVPADLSLAGERREVTLTPAQEQALETLLRVSALPGPTRYLLHGVTGSGKTEVYLRLIRNVIERGSGALLLVPEIGLTPMLSRIAVSNFPGRVALIHSGMPPGERLDQWSRIRNGEAALVVGTRSGVFAPVAGLKLIVIDEEQDPSYKQDAPPFYHAREVAWQRLQADGGLLVLGSATPSVETFHAARVTGSIGYLSLPDRIEKRPLPTVRIVDMGLEFQRHGRRTVVSNELRSGIENRLRRKEQAIVLLNRRGYSRLLLCRSCGNVSTCADCSVALTYHQSENRLICHYCGVERLVPPACEVCSGQYIYFVGAGTEQLEEALRGFFPDARLARLDRDSTRRKGMLRRTLLDFEEGKLDLLVGTQMLAKGHDFPNVTLVGVVGGDAGLAFPDFRSAERTFQLLTQVAGRAGRGDYPGEVIIQCLYPDHYALRHAREQDYAGFFEREVEFRRAMGYPPFESLVQIVVEDPLELKAHRLAAAAAAALRAAASENPGSVRVLGPAAAPIEKLRGKYRVQLLLKVSTGASAGPVLTRAFAHLSESRISVRKFRVDVDPVSLL